jgi:hypothetical protein
LVIGIMAQRFGSPSGTHESGTEEEFEWAVESWRARGYPEVKWYFRKIEGLQVDPDPDKARAGIEQWQKVLAFRARMDEMEPRLYTREFCDLAAFGELLDQDLGQWLNAPERPWVTDGAGSDRPSPPDDHLIRLARSLDDAFVEQMRTGENVNAEQATARYVPMVFRARTAEDSQKREKRSEGRLEDFLATERRLLVVGGGGGGKTTTLRHLAAQTAGRALADPRAPVPVYVRLNSFDSPENGLAALLRLIGVALDLEPAQAERQWRGGDRPLLFLFDGLNEVARDYRETCTRALLTMLQGPGPQHRYVVTTRPGGPLERVADHPTEGSGLVVLDLLDLRPEQIKRYVEAQGRSASYERIRRQVEGLAASPFLLWAATRALGSTSAGAAGHSRGALLRHLVDHYIYEVRERGKPAPRPTTYDYALVKKPVLARLALKMSSEERTVVPENLELQQGVLAHLREIEKTYEGIYELTPEAFMPPDRTPVGLLDEVVDNGVLIREGGTLRFLHESVQEYFAASALEDEPPHMLVERAPEWSPDRHKVRGPDFEILVMLSGLLDHTAAGTLAVALLPHNPLLAAYVGQEAGLHGTAAEPLWDHYVELLDSRQEGGRMLGLECVSVLPSLRQDIVAWLLRTAWSELRGAGITNAMADVLVSARIPDGELSEFLRLAAQEVQGQQLFGLAISLPQFIDERGVGQEALDSCLSPGRLNDDQMNWVAMYMADVKTQAGLAWCHSRLTSQLRNDVAYNSFLQRHFDIIIDHYYDDMAAYLFHPNRGPGGYNVDSFELIIGHMEDPAPFQRRWIEWINDGYFDRDRMEGWESPRVLYIILGKHWGDPRFGDIVEAIETRVHLLMKSNSRDQLRSGLYHLVAMVDARYRGADRVLEETVSRVHGLDEDYQLFRLIREALEAVAAYNLVPSDKTREALITQRYLKLADEDQSEITGYFRRMSDGNGPKAETNDESE